MSEQINAGWAVVMTKPQAEELAEDSIRAAGFDPWLPTYRKRLKGLRIDDNGRRVRSRTDGVEARPLFPCYLFVPIPDYDNGYAIDTADGVRKLIRYPAVDMAWGRPKLIRARVIEQIRAACAAGAFDEVCAAGASSLKPGDTIKTLAGIVGTIKALDHKGRVDFAAQMFGAEVVVRGVYAQTLELVSC